jgi:hypothetical protein
VAARPGRFFRRTKAQLLKDNEKISASPDQSCGGVAGDFRASYVASAINQHWLDHPIRPRNHLLGAEAVLNRDAR